MDCAVKNNIEESVFRVLECSRDFPEGSDWLKMDEYALWHEMVACILGSRVVFESAQRATDHLHTLGLLNVRQALLDLGKSEQLIYDALSFPLLSIEQRGFGRRYPFPKLRANHIRRTIESLYMPGHTINQILATAKDAKDARLRIMSAAVGIGPKQASLFLRNIRYTNDLAILDTHVLKYMILIGLLEPDFRGLSNLFSYEVVENLLLEYSLRRGVLLSKLDTAIWVVMRVYSREFAS
ncbi:MAG: hypothetical protein AAC990_05945 [Dehalococcoides mccartyi]|uniref:8-oxoguanine DNA glycosylase n=1 Tax=Dehalococcoides mccartyi TaxID=61435 RepID=UPI0030F8BF3A